MSFGFNSQISKNKYEIQITTDNYEQFLFIQKMAHECVDGKHKEEKGNIETSSEYYGCTYSPNYCKNCPNNLSKYNYYGSFCSTTSTR